MTIILDRACGLAERQGRLKARTHKPCGIVVHSTGAGPFSRHLANPERFALPYDAARHIYEHISPYCGHFLVCGETGMVTQLVPVEKQAWHVGSKGSWKYRLPGWRGTKGLTWWARRHKGASSPRDLLGGRLWRSASANALTIGIEVSPPLAGPRAPWTPKAWESLSRLIKYLAFVHDIPLTTDAILTHSDAHPLARCTRKGAPWDPAPKQWRISEAAEKLGIHWTK